MKKQNTYTALADIPVPNTAVIEWQVLSDVLADNGAMAAVSDIVDESLFTSDLRRKVWNECLRRFNEGLPFDMPNVAVAVGPEFVQHIYSGNGVDDLGFRYADEHARSLRQDHARVVMYQTAMETLRLSQTQGLTEVEMYTAMTEAVSRLEPSGDKREVSLVDAINGLAEEIRERTADMKAGRPNRITSGMACLDDVLYGGLAPGNLVVLSARPSVGKTALALYMVRKAAGAGARPAFFSIEMTTDELAMRMIASVTEEYEDENYPGVGNPRRSKVSMYKIANGFDSDDDWDRFEEAVGELDHLEMTINDSARDLRDIVSRMTVLNKQGRCDVAFIDYLGLIRQAQADPRAPLYQQIADITGTLKATAKSLRIPIVLLCQLNRDAAKTGGAPQLYNLRDSGSIEQDADVVLMLNQVPGPRGFDLEVVVRKNRQGEKDFGILLRPSDNYMDFTEIGITKPQ